LTFIEQLHFSLIACPLKQLTGFDCPGCGFQRSVIALFHGDLATSLHLYPATLPIFVLAGMYIPFRSSIPGEPNPARRKVWFLVIAIVTISYGIKLVNYLI
jgi:hypothetical protein